MKLTLRGPLLSGHHWENKPMQRQRNSLVPIAESLAALPGAVQAIRKATPQALHHFTLSDQVNQLVSASEADPNRGFMARLTALYLPLVSEE